MIENSEISIVMQGGLAVGYDVRYAVKYMRTVFPGSPIILSTQEGEAKTFSGHADFDEVVLTPDPGVLPPVKFDGAPHNLNRQITSSAAGLRAVRTPYALKLRTDAYLSSRAVADIWSSWEDTPPGPNLKGQSRILATSFFTVDPRYDERVPYHVSDWLQFGRTADLLKLWDCREYDFGTGTWYERNRHQAGSLPREKQFRSRLSSEQWLTLNYLFGDGPYPIQNHNDCSPEIIDRFEDDLVDNFIVVHPIDIDLQMPKHKWVFKSIYFNFICYSYEDWKGLLLRKRGLVRPTIAGYTRWPRTPFEKKLYLFMRTDPRVRWLRKVPGPLGRKLHRLFYSWK